jgi:enediyne biosynthesis protein E4
VKNWAQITQIKLMFANVFWRRKSASICLICVICAQFVCCQSPYFREHPLPFTNAVQETDSLNILTYPYCYNGGGVAAGDLNNDGLIDLFFTANRRGGNRLLLNKGELQFADATDSAGVTGRSDWNTGVTLTDVNADGWLDIYVCGVNLPGLLSSRNELWVNQRNGRFLEQAAQYGLDFQGHSTQAVFFDYDRDGDLDCYLLNHAANLRDDYHPATDRLTTDAESGDRLYQNTGNAQNGHYVDVSARAGILRSGLAFGLGVAVGDLNNDGWPDIYVSNDFREHDYTYLNRGDGTFAEVGQTLFAHHSRFSMGCDIADYTNDGRADLIVADMLPADERVLKASNGDDEADTYDYKQGFGFHYQVSRNTLQTNLGPDNQGSMPPFSDRALQMGVAATDWSWSPLLADFDNDGRKDLFISNGIKRRTNDLDFAKFVRQPNHEQAFASRKGLLNIIAEMPPGDVPDYFFRNTPDGFRDESAAAGFDRPTLSNGATYADLDNDGDLDLIVNRLNEPSAVYENRMPRQNSLTIELRGPAGNPFGIGTRVDVWAGGQQQTVERFFTRGFQSATAAPLHVGLGTYAEADSVQVRWPDGRAQVLRGVRAGRVVVSWKSADGMGMDAEQTPQGATKPLRGVGDPVPRKGFVAPCGVCSASIGWTHHENTYNDFAANPFIPHKLSTQGPKAAVGDVNADGLDDLYLCGAAGQPGTLLMQQQTGQFIPANVPVLAQDAAFEDVDALFVDVDGDHDLDLYVASGGNERFGNDPLLHDRLYLNDGKGHFTKDTNLPALTETKSCVRAADVDRDGDMDLFVGGRVNARLYGATPTSVLLRNNGRGSFMPEPIPLGLVTDARFTDPDRDGWPDLLLVGEWMPPTLLRNERGQLNKTKTDLPTGLWTCLMPLPNGDFVAGNWGLNSKLRASETYPLRYYLADPDQNGEQDGLLAVAKNGVYYPFLGKDKLEQRLPHLKKTYLHYRDAGVSLEKLFGDALANARVLEAKTLQSGTLHWQDGRYIFTPLPAEAQAGPLLCGLALPGDKLLTGSGFRGVQPYEGPYDALLPTLWQRTREGFKVSQRINLPGELRDMKHIRLAGGRQGVLVLTNNGPAYVWMLPLQQN